MEKMNVKRRELLVKRRFHSILLKIGFKQLGANLLDSGLGIL